MDVAPSLGQVDDGVDDDLARAVIGHVAAAIGLVQLDAAAGQLIARHAKMALLARPAEGDDWVVLEEEQGGILAAADALDEAQLQTEGFAVADARDAEDVAGGHGRIPDSRFRTPDWRQDSAGPLPGQKGLSAAPLDGRPTCFAHGQRVSQAL